ncbi:unnamed protein product [Fusarium graminearum]|uniref:Uncharacterized protein n=1 Tax=Gibberella zeae TaxID=5518 RepID=A0A9N8RN70_GIBZA|nr:unnamed protein product [Fusarium graminearum]
MGTDELKILGHILITVADSQKSQHPFTIDVESIEGGDPSETLFQLWNQLLDECKQIALKIPQSVRIIIGKKIQTRRDIEPAAQPFASCQSDSNNYTQISHAPTELSRSTGVGILSAIRDSPTIGTEEGPAGRISSSSSAIKPLAQNPAPVRRFPKTTEAPFPCFSRKVLKSWAISPEKFLNQEEIDVNKSGIYNYIEALKKSKHLNVFRIRFALLQLYKSRETWPPYGKKTFRDKLGANPNTLNSWLKEDPRRKKKRPIDDLVTECDTETDIGKSQAKKQGLEFTPEELKLPEICVTDDADENRESVEDLIKAAAESIATRLEEIHQKAGLYYLNGTETNILAQSHNGGMQPSAKRVCQSHDSHGLREGPHSSQDAANLAMNDDPTSDVSNTSLAWNQLPNRGDQPPYSLSENTAYLLPKQRPCILGSAETGMRHETASYEATTCFEQPVQLQPSAYHEASPQSPLNAISPEAARLHEAELKKGMDASDNLPSVDILLGYGSLQSQHTNDLAFGDPQGMDCQHGNTEDLHWNMAGILNFQSLFDYVNLDTPQPLSAPETWCNTS